MANKSEKTELEKKLEAELAAQAAAEVSEAEERKSREEEAAVSSEPDPVLIARLSEAVAERDALRDQLLRARAEFDNYRKRTAREIEGIRKAAAADLIRDLLPVVDNLERALSHAGEPRDGLAQGVDLVLRHFCEMLAARGLEPIPALGEPFNPEVHEALAQQPSEEYPADAVMAEWERGYRIGDLVLRPAKVVVSGGSAETENAPADEAQEAAVDENENNA